MENLEMDNQLLVRLLQLQFEHHHKLQEFAGKMNLDYLEIDLLSVVLDELGVPADNTFEQVEKYGYFDWANRPDTCSRHTYYEDFEKQITRGSAEECRAYLETVVNHPQTCGSLRADQW
jgi:hypothetical protein